MHPWEFSHSVAHPKVGVQQKVPVSAATFSYGHSLRVAASFNYVVKRTAGRGYGISLFFNMPLPLTTALAFIGGIVDLLKQVLEAVSHGKLQFAPDGEGEEKLLEFQAGAMALHFAESEGYLGKVDLHKTAVTGVWLVDAVFVSEGLTYKGLVFLKGESLGNAPEKRLEDVIEIRPNFMGVGLNLRELYRRLF